MMTDASPARAVRTWPYPYDAAVAISNDAEFMSIEFFDALMRFLNTREGTPFGTGLGLEVRSSFFAFSAHPYNFAYFDDPQPGARPGRDADRIHEYVREGWIDTIHAFGDFDGLGGFRRGHAERYAEESTRRGWTIPVFTNHGSVDNVQNVGSDAPYHRGDRPGDPAYHVDLWLHLGIRHVWTDSMTYAADRPARGGFAGIRTRLRQALAGRLPGRPRPPQAYFAGEPGQRQGEIALQDGFRCNGFRRFRSTGINAPNLSSLGDQLRQVDWPDFYARESMMVIYQHLGVLSRHEGCCAAATIDAVRADPEAYLAPFRFLAAESASGRLWVVGTARLLDFERACRELELREEPMGVIHLATRTRDALPRGIATLSGLTIYEDRPISGVRLEGRMVPIHRNGPDRTGRSSVSLL